jgi:hypothetical protein
MWCWKHFFWICKFQTSICHLCKFSLVFLDSEPILFNFKKILEAKKTINLKFLNFFKELTILWKTWQFMVGSLTRLFDFKKNPYWRSKWMIIWFFGTRNQGFKIDSLIWKIIGKKYIPLHTNSRLQRMRTFQHCFGHLDIKHLQMIQWFPQGQV